MSWNYRVVKNLNGGYALHEIYYDEKGEIAMWSDPVTRGEDSVEELKDWLRLLLEECDKPVIETIDVPEGIRTRPLCP